MPPNLAAVGRTLAPHRLDYDWRDVVLYAAAIGTGPAQLPFLLEPEPRVMPSWLVIPEAQPVFEALHEAGFTLDKLLHTAQRSELLAPFPPRGQVETTATIAGIYDMRIGALVQIETRSSVDGVARAASTWSLLIAGVGEFASSRPPPSLKVKPPKDAAPTFSESWTTAPNQALLYRLTGDFNPIHARPEVAQAAGLPQPILHGLCTFGFAARAALHALCDDDPGRFQSLEARFTKPVLPGQTLRTDGYVQAPGQAVLTVTVVDSGEYALHALLRYV